ncbi:hypothetical protein KKG41_02370 [Patescibacteria group bacterium]|nr:hypothetical protein [Patescibacteria group bacterium]
MNDLLRADFNCCAHTLGEIMLALNQALKLSRVSGLQLVQGTEWPFDYNGLADLIIGRARMMVGGETPSEASPSEDPQNEAPSEDLSVTQDDEKVAEAASYLLLRLHDLIHDINDPGVPFAYFVLKNEADPLLDRILEGGRKDGGISGLVEVVTDYQGRCDEAGIRLLRFLPTTEFQLRVYANLPTDGDDLTPLQCSRIVVELSRDGYMDRPMTMNDADFRAVVDRVRTALETRQALIDELPNQLRPALMKLGLSTDAVIVVSDNLGSDPPSLEGVGKVTINIGQGMDGSFALSVEPAGSQRRSARGMFESMFGPVFGLLSSGRR